MAPSSQGLEAGNPGRFTGKILIANLSKGKLGEDASSLLGALLVSGFEAAALGRVDTPEGQRRDFYHYLDEVQNFATLSIVGMLQEPGNTGSGSSWPTNTSSNSRLLLTAILGNIGTPIAFRVGARDAKVLADEFFPEFSGEDLVSLPRYHVYPFGS